MTSKEAAMEAIRLIELGFDSTCVAARDVYGLQCVPWADNAVVFSFAGAISRAAHTIDNKSALALIGLLSAKFGPDARKVTDKDEAIRRLRACL